MVKLGGNGTISEDLQPGITGGGGEGALSARLLPAALTGLCSKGSLASLGPWLTTEPPQTHNGKWPLLEGTY